MWKKIKHGYRAFVESEPGHRFVEAYEEWQESVRNPLVSIGLIVAAIVLMVGGLLLALVPGVPGIVLGVIGFALIAIRFRRVAIWLDWTEVHLRRLFRRFRRGHAAR